MDKKMFKRARYTLELKREQAISCAEDYGTSVSRIVIHELNGYIEGLLDMKIVSSNGYLLLSKWVRNLNKYLEDNYKCKLY